MDEYEIVDRVKDWYRTTSNKPVYNFLLNNATVMSQKLYKRSYRHNPSISKQVIGYVYNDKTRFVSDLVFPMLTTWYVILYIYLYKKGYIPTGDSPLGPAPLPNLKYIIYCITSSVKHTGITGYEFKDRLVIELVDLDVAANNLNLPKIMSSVLGPKLLSENMMSILAFSEINDLMLSQKLFAGHTWKDAYYIVSRYFDGNKHELSKEVFKISEAYERVFRPRRVVYNTKTWQPVLP